MDPWNPYGFVVEGGPPGPGWVESRVPPKPGGERTPGRSPYLELDIITHPYPSGQRSFGRAESALRAAPQHGDRVGPSTEERLRNWVCRNEYTPKKSAHPSLTFRDLSEIWCSYF